MVILVAIVCFLIILTVQCINRAVSGKPNGSLLGEGVAAVGFGILLFAVAAIVVGAVLILAWPLVLVAIAIIAVVASIARGRSQER